MGPHQRNANISRGFHCKKQVLKHSHRSPRPQFSLLLENSNIQYVDCKNCRPIKAVGVSLSPPYVLMSVFPLCVYSQVGQGCFPVHSSVPITALHFSSGELSHLPSTLKDRVTLPSSPICSSTLHGNSQAP